jgi:hypothetical protein
MSVIGGATAAAGVDGAAAKLFVALVAVCAAMHSP